MGKKMNKEIRKCDIYVIIIMFLVIGTHLITNFFMQLKSKETKADIEYVVKAYETNPFKQIQLLSNKFLTMLLYLINPGIILFIYWLYRKRVKQGKTEILALQSFVMVMLFVMLINFLNDFSILAGLLAKGW